MSDTYFKEFCPKCKTKNWFYAGDPLDQDCSKMDESLILECFKCHFKFIAWDVLYNIGGGIEEDVCEMQDFSLWEEVDKNFEEFLKRVETNLGRESLE
jgi:hypothetical protein